MKAKGLPSNRYQVNKSEGEWLEKKAALEQCDASVMAYFSDYFWFDADVFKVFIDALKRGEMPNGTT